MSSLINVDASVARCEVQTNVEAGIVIPPKSHCPHLENEDRFRTPELLRQHGIHRAMNVILQGDGKPFGVLEVDSKSDGQFVEQDIAFLQGAANILGMAIERDRRERRLEMALERQQSLLKEVNHRAGEAGWTMLEQS